MNIEAVKERVRKRLETIKATNDLGVYAGHYAEDVAELLAELEGRPTPQGQEAYEALGSSGSGIPRILAELATVTHVDSVVAKPVNLCFIVFAREHGLIDRGRLLAIEDWATKELGFSITVEVCAHQGRLAEVTQT
jgi:hypothetical protein